MTDITKSFSNICDAYGIRFDEQRSILPYDNTGLFVYRGSERYQRLYENGVVHGIAVGTKQACIRMEDIDLMGDGAHLIYFNMLGMFTFRHWSIKQAIHFWIDYLADLGIKPDYVTVHPDKSVWSIHSSEEEIEVKTDDSCIKQHGPMDGYYTEFYYHGMKIGRISNPLGQCINSAFGVERLDMLVNNISPLNRTETIIKGIDQMIFAGIVPANTGAGHELRRLLCLLNNLGGHIDHHFFHQEIARLAKVRERYELVKARNANIEPDLLRIHGIKAEEISV